MFSQLLAARRYLNDLMDLPNPNRQRVQELLMKRNQLDDIAEKHIDRIIEESEDLL